MRATTTVRVPPDEDLVWLLCEAEGALGVTSNFGPLTDAALGGWGGTADRERRITDRRHGFGPAGSNDVGRARKLRTAFMALDSAHRDALWLAYGPHVWPRETGRLLGGLAGIALLTKAAHAGYTKALKRHNAQDKGLGFWIVSACLLGDSEALEAIRAEAAELLGDALDAWRGPAKSERRPRASRASWRPPLVMGGS